MPGHAGMDPASRFGVTPPPCPWGATKAPGRNRGFPVPDGNACALICANVYAHTLGTFHFLQEPFPRLTPEDAGGIFVYRADQVGDVPGWRLGSESPPFQVAVPAIEHPLTGGRLVPELGHLTECPHALLVEVRALFQERDCASPGLVQEANPVFEVRGNPFVGEPAEELLRVDAHLEGHVHGHTVLAAVFHSAYFSWTTSSRLSALATRWRVRRV